VIKAKPFRRGGQANIYEATTPDSKSEPLILKVFKYEAKDDLAALHADARSEFEAAEADPILQAQAFTYLEGGIPAFLMRKVSGHSLFQTLAADGNFKQGKQEFNLTFQQRLQIWASTLSTYGVQVYPDWVHYDLNPNNILIFYEKNAGYIAKIVDKGFAKRTGITPTRHQGTIGYAAPEQFIGFKKINTSPKTDVYALGQIGYDIFKSRPRTDILNEILKETGSDPNATKRIFHQHSDPILKEQKATLFNNIKEAPNEFLLEKSLINQSIAQTQYWGQEARIEPEELIATGQFILELHDAINAEEINTVAMRFEKMQEFFAVNHAITTDIQTLAEIIGDKAEYLFLVKYTHTLIAFFAKKNMPATFKAIAVSIVQEYNTALKQVPGIMPEFANKFCIKLAENYQFDISIEQLENKNLIAQDNVAPEPIDNPPPVGQKKLPLHALAKIDRKMPVDEIEGYFTFAIKAINYKENISPYSHRRLLENMQILRGHVLSEYDKLEPDLHSNERQTATYAKRRRGELLQFAKSTFETTKSVFSNELLADKNKAVRDFKQSANNLYHTDKKIMGIILGILCILGQTILYSIIGGLTGHAPGAVIGAGMGFMAGLSTSNTLFFTNPAKEVAKGLQGVCKEQARDEQCNANTGPVLTT
jgi:serine/threonine protein kinase